MDDADTRHWVTIAEAARLLGKSKRQIWRYVADDRMAIRRDVAPAVVDIIGWPIVTPEAAPTPTPGIDTAALQERIQALERDIERLRAEADRWWQAHMMLLATQQRLLEAAQAEPPTARQWRWPWQR
jgi:hypothetical protein